MSDSDEDTGDLETMRATCPTCDTTYTIPDERIGAKGRKVRCTKCGDEWKVVLSAEPVEDDFAAEPAPPPPPAPKPATAKPAAAVDPFDAVDDIDFAPPSRAAAPPPDAFAEPTAPTTSFAEQAEAAVAQELEAPSGPAHPLAGRVRIRTRSRLPKIGREALRNAALRLAPFVGPAVFLAACLVVASTWVFRQAIVAKAPDLAGLYSALGAPINLRGLVFGRIETMREIDSGQPVLVVEGSISNVTKQMREVPALRFALRGSDTQELYAWSIDPRSTTIESGDTIRFRTRLAAPPDQATEVQVRFVERRSQHAGLP